MSGLSIGVPWKLAVAGAVVASTTVLSACASDPRPSTQDDCAAKGTCKEPPITSATATIAGAFVLGHSETSSSATLTVTADASTSWTLTASEPWIGVPAAPNTGAGQVEVRIDASGLDVGHHTGSIVVTSTTDAENTATIHVSADIQAPNFTVSQANLIFGGADGVERTGAQLLQLQLDTGSNAYPWSATVTTNAGGPWLSMTSTSGSAGSAATAVEVNADRSVVAPGRYTGTVRIEATVRGVTYTRTVAVLFNKEGHWLHASALGVAFSSFPGRSALARTLVVRSSQERTDTPWTAQSDQSWLTVTPSGVTGGDLTLTADPSGLATNKQYFANVTVTSPDSSILNQQSIRVGLRLGSKAPVDVAIQGTFPNVVANPVEPYVYVNTEGASITVYDIYSGAVVHTFASVAGRAEQMVVSSDGRALFVNDEANARVVALDAETGAELHRYAWGTTFSGGLGYARPSAHPVLLIGVGRAYDLATGALYLNGVFGESFDVDSHDRFVYVQDTGGSPSQLRQYAISITALRDDPFVVGGGRTNSGGSNGQDICVSADGARVYSANGAPYDFSAFTTSDMMPVQTLTASAYPNNAACSWNGLFFGSASPGDASNVWVYRPDGTLVASFAVNPGPLPATLVLSGDSTRFAVATGSFSTATPGLFLRNAPSP